MNLNRYAGWGSSIPWHCDNEPLFGDQGDPKVIVSISLGSSVDFRVCRRGRRNAPSSIRLDRGDLLVMDGLAQSEYERSTSSELQGPRVNFTYRWVTEHAPTCRLLRAGAGWALPPCAQGLPGLGRRGRVFFFNAAFGPAGAGSSLRDLPGSWQLVGDSRVCFSLATRDPGSLETALEDSVDPFVDPVNSLHYPVSFLGDPA